MQEVVDDGYVLEDVCGRVICGTQFTCYSLLFTWWSFTDNTKVVFLLLDSVAIAANCVYNMSTGVIQLFDLWFGDLFLELV